MPDDPSPNDPIVVRPPEFEKVLEELHVVRLGSHLKNEIQARRDLEDVYHGLLEDVTELEARIEKGRIDVERAEEEARRAAASETRARADQAQLRSRLGYTRVACYILAAAAAGLAVIAWDDLSKMVVDLLMRFIT